MRKLRDLYLIFVLFLLLFSGTQASEEFLCADFSNKIENDIHSISFSATTNQDILSSTPPSGVIPEISCVLSHRLLCANSKTPNRKSPFFHRSLLVHAVLQPATYQINKFQHDILSERHSNGFHFYFLKKIII